MEVLGRSRMAAVERPRDGVVVTLVDGREVEGSHALLAVGSIPQTSGIGLEEVGVTLSESGTHCGGPGLAHVRARRVCRGRLHGVLPLASVAAMQGRIAMAHALGDAVAPLNLRRRLGEHLHRSRDRHGWLSQKDARRGHRRRRPSIMLPLARNPRAKMQGITDGFVKLFAQRGFGTVMGGVVVAPRASELIYPVTLAVHHRLTVDQLARTFTVYPSLSGSIAEAARQLHTTDS